MMNELNAMVKESLLKAGFEVEYEDGCRHVVADVYCLEFDASNPEHAEGIPWKVQEGYEDNEAEVQYRKEIYEDCGWEGLPTHMARVLFGTTEPGSDDWTVNSVDGALHYFRVNEDGTLTKLWEEYTPQEVYGLSAEVAREWMVTGEWRGL